jgi:Tfp pilus assembly protein PilE
MKISLKIRGRSGLTLTELVIASILVGIVSIGIFSVDYALRGSRAAASDDSILAMKTWATMEHITKNAKLAVGDITNPGIIAPSGNNYLCFRQDTATTPNDYTDDLWRCYSKFSNNIHTCTKTALSGPSACNSGDEAIGTYALEDSCSVNCELFTYNFVQNSSLHKLYLDISITNRLNPATPSDPMDNPNYTLQTRIFPEGQSYY